MELEKLPEGKVCNCCGEYKLLEEFHKGNGKFGHRGECKLCCKKKYEDGVKGEERKEKRRIAQKIRRQDPKYKQHEYNQDKLTRSTNYDSIKKTLLRSAKQRAKNKGLEFTITIEDFELPEVCPLLNIPLKVNEGLADSNSYSLDRKDSSKGYVKDNV